MTFQAFSDQATSYNVANLTFENNSDYVSVYGDIQIKRDLEGLAQLQEIKQLVDEALAQLQKIHDLPEKLNLGDDNEEIDNPFLA